MGDPPEIARCPSGFPGCACGDELMLDSSEADEQTRRVVAWWDGKP